MALQETPDKYLRFNNLQTKNLALVVQIPGLDLLASTTIFTIPKYGDPGLFYGDPDLFYGGVRAMSGVQDLLSLDGSNLTISQTIEPEQGRGSITTLSLSFIDKNGYMSQAISPGLLIPDIMGIEAKVYLGYKELSFPEDYFVIFRGRVSGVTVEPGRVNIQLSDPNIKRKGKIFYSAKTTLGSTITSIATTIPVASNADFHRQILGPDATYDDAIKTYIKIEDEIIEYPATGFGSNQFTSVTRGARGTTAAAHAADEEVSALIQIEDHAIDMALKIMLSGWNGDWVSGIDILNLVTTGDPDLGDVSNAVVLPLSVDAVRDYGLVAGDYVTIIGSAFGGNNAQWKILGFVDIGDQKNRIILIDGTLTAEAPSPATFSIRSQYDTYPVSCGSKLPETEVDIDQFIFLKNTFLGSSDFSYRFLIDEEEGAKEFMEREIYLPIAMYSLTRQGKLSAGLTKPPLADQRLQTLTKDNVLNPGEIKPMRQLNNRKFFNELHWDWDIDDAGDFQTRVRSIETNSLNIIGISEVLPLPSKGGRTDLGYQNTITRRTRFLFNRYKQGAIVIPMKVNWEVGNQIEAGDTVLVVDDGGLQITDMATGNRTLGVQLFEVINRSLDIKSGQVSLQLLTGLGASVDDRFATISPSSRVDTGSTTTRIRIKDSFGAIFPGRERDKWKDYVGLPIRVHNDDYTFDEETVIQSLPLDDLYALEVSPALSLAPPADYVVDIVDYSTSTDPTVNALYKLVHAHLTPSVLVATGISTTQFTVGAGDIAKFKIGQLILIHNNDFSILSPEVTITNITGTTITVGSSLGFTPAAGQYIELIGFADFTEAANGRPYRFI